jgi:hypothetical protein
MIAARTCLAASDEERGDECDAMRAAHSMSAKSMLRGAAPFTTTLAMIASRTACGTTPMCANACIWIVSFVIDAHAPRRRQM